MYKCEITRQAYSTDYLENICNDIGIKDEEQKMLFSERVLFAGGRFLNIKGLNTNRLRPHEQNKILDQYREALQQAQLKYREICDSSSANYKLRVAVRKQFEKTTESRMKEMFKPYCDGEIVAITLFDRFLGVLIEAALDAKNQGLDNDKADLSGDFLMHWVVAIGKRWPKEASIKFALGKHDKETKMYTSPSIPILHDIINKIDSGVSEKEIENAMRKIIKNGLINQPVANYFLL